ncbi:DNA phosphorothioation-dependent restriction protein DptH [Pedobacter rhizosphaerae]|uniref:DNA phosphorothioation-dependent restriction protein DptH n=1 Tax=Pedobacter rhizosphaerae TaxID=390241 RepID=A0A1H9T244_9SPHI|nr:DNA phosphorothioation-dependent restriction protein DptH [Pedobacter rhizosphaerae]SER91218.1 DNA phosphorothioation-dependent restriction protein DptH [Pedobacter rhizosphaerae]
MIETKEYIYDYISEVLLDYLSKNHISPGEKFHIKYEQAEQVFEQYNALEDIAKRDGYDVAPFTHEDYHTYSIKLAGCRLVIAASAPDVSEDFLTGLRNQISDGKENFEGAAILFIHNTSLDSIVGGCKSLSETSKPLNVNYVRDKIKNQIQQDPHFSKSDKLVLRFRIDDSAEDRDDDFSLFNYSIFLRILGKKKIELEDYAKLGLFPDRGLKTVSDEDGLKRLFKNEEWFDQVSNGHQYGGLDKILERQFSQEGVTKLSRPQDWMNEDLTDVSNWNTERNKTTNITYSPNVTELTDDLLTCWDSADGDSLAKERIRHILIFNHQLLARVNFSLNFDGRLRKEGLSQPKNLTGSEYSISGRKIQMTMIAGDHEGVVMKSISYTQPGFSSKFVFNFLIVPFKAQILLGIKSFYRIKGKPNDWHLLLKTKDAITFNPGQESVLSEKIREDSVFTLNEGRSLVLQPDVVLSDSEIEDIKFSIQYEDLIIPLHLAVDNEVPQFISAQEVREKKIVGGSFTYTSVSEKDKITVTLSQGTKRYYVKEEFRENLAFEQSIINADYLAFYQHLDNNLLPKEDILVDHSVRQAYLALLEYFRIHRLLPSLAQLTPTLHDLYSTFLGSFLQALEGIETGKALHHNQGDLLRIGSVEMTSGNKMLKLSPLHPINIAYLLKVTEKLNGEELASYLFKRLRPINLVPYIKGNQKKSGDGHYYYQPIEHTGSREWLYYFCDEVYAQQVSKHFVPDLVHKKLDQFLKHFAYLFVGQRSVLKINVFNQGDCSEIVQGILSYYAKFFRQEKLKADDAVSIQVKIYGSHGYMTKFEELTLCDQVENLEKSFDIKLPFVPDPDELFDLYSKKLTFFKVEDGNEYSYAHLSFYQFAPSQVAKNANNIFEIPSGVSLDGLMADVPSVFQRDSFRTGFGAEGREVENGSFLGLINKLNSYAKVVNSHDQYNPNEAIGFVINKNASNQLEGIYSNSQWVTFIEPKVDLTFFKSFKDIVIIHYSDQYNNASGYDAITITSKWIPYKATIQEVFRQQEEEISDEALIHVIDQFNAINGEWLLDLNTPTKNAGYFRMEKLSMLSAVKSMLAILDHPDITWVPISLEEILRVSGAVGLKQADGLFSAKNLGSEGVHSDDLLFVGLEETDGELAMYLYPVEVKIGNIDPATILKAKEQSAKTAGLLRKYLMDEDRLAAKIYRNFFAKLMLISAEKFALYNVWPEYSEKWQSIASHKARLLNDDFRILNTLDRHIGYFGVLAFKWASEFMSRSIAYDDDGCIVTLLKGDSLRALHEGVSILRNELDTETLDSIKAKSLLRHRYLDSDEVDEFESKPALQLEIELLQDDEDGFDVGTTTLTFNKLAQTDIIKIYSAVYEKLTAIGIGIIKDLPGDIHFFEGPAFYRFEIRPAPGTLIKKLKSATEELNIALELPEGSSVRIFSDLGKIWLEAPKSEDQKVTVTTEHLWSRFVKNEDFRIPFGVDIEGNVSTVNLSSSNSPHLLLAGTTGSGKSVVLDTLIRSAAHFYSPAELRLYLVDPKGNELIDFEDLEHTPRPNGMSSEEAIALLEEAVQEMDRRYVLFRTIRESSGRAAKDINDYNSFVSAEKALLLPRWLIVLDEYSDLLDENPANKSTIELLLKRLAQKARAAGIHVIVATQKPLVNIISSAIKSNLPGVIALRVRTAVDSRVILDDAGAETLAGRGDALFKNGTGKMVRIQCAIYDPG